MKIEKVNDHQIRCTLTKADLADRELKISELAYGTEKAKSLFRDMMQQAAIKFGFEAEDIPLMIEAIPLNSDCIVLIITKVEDPEELDTRFSKFAPSVHESEGEYEEGSDNLMSDISAASDDVLDLFRRIKDKVASKNSSEKGGTLSGDNATPAPDKAVSSVSAKATDKPEEKAVNTTRIFSFSSLYNITKPAVILKETYHGESTLYKDSEKGVYLMVLHKAD